MIRRLRCVSVALFALLTAASACLAAEPGYAPKKGGIGGGIGVSKFIEDADYSHEAWGRFSFSGAFRYVVSPKFRWQVSPGFTWSAYTGGSVAPFIDPHHPTDLYLNGQPKKEDYLALVVPITAQVQATLRRGWWIYHLGTGPGVYRVMVENHRQVLMDPRTDRLHRGLYPGVTAELGAERFLRGLTTTSVEGVVDGHLIFAQRNDQFPSGWNSNLLPVELRVCVNYYFDMNRQKKSSGAGATPGP